MSEELTTDEVTRLRALLARDRMKGRLRALAKKELGEGNEQHPEKLVHVASAMLTLLFFLEDADIAEATSVDDATLDALLRNTLEAAK